MTDLSKLIELLSTMSGCSVTQRIKTMKQPRGGYIKPKDMDSISLGKGIESLNPDESTHAGLVGTAVDYLTRFLLGASVEDAFQISLLGAKIIQKDAKAKKLMTYIKGLDNQSVINAVKLCGFDVCYRAGIMRYKPVEKIMPDSASIENIVTMVKRSLNFFNEYGPKILNGFTFEGGYTNVVSSGDGDFMTKDTLWDFKVSKFPIKKEHTLQLLMYWRMGLHSIHPEFKNIQYLGIYNPRLNVVSRISVTDISDDVIRKVETEVIGYKEYYNETTKQF